MLVSVVVLCVLCAFVVKNPLSAPSCSERAWHRLGCQPLHASIMRAPDTMQGTYTRHFLPSAPLFSPLVAALNMTCIFSMSLNVPMFIVKFPTALRALQVKHFRCGEIWRSARQPLSFAVSAHRLFRKWLPICRARDTISALPAGGTKTGASIAPAPALS